MTQQNESTTQTRELESRIDDFLPADAIECRLLRTDLKTAKELLDELISETQGVLTRTSRGRKLRERVQRFLVGEPSPAALQPSAEQEQEK